MNSYDLDYLLSPFEEKNKNFYSSNIKAGTNGIYIDYLKKNDINHKVEEVTPIIKSINLLTKNNNEISTIENPIYPNNNKYGISIMKDKFKTENHLEQFNIKTTSSKIYTYNEMKNAKIDFFKNNSERKAVIKPLNGSLSRGVYVNVSKERFEENWNFSLRDRKNKKNAKVLVQEYLQGFEVRATILQGKLISIIARTPAYVTGNGYNNIEELIRIKNRERKKCNYLRKHPIILNNKHKEFLLSSSLSLNEVPENNKNILLSSISNTVNGGEIINITNLVSNDIKEFALNTLATFPGMYSGGLDIMLKSFNDTNPSVLEVNNFPVISLTKFPTYGKESFPEQVVIESLIAQYQFMNKTSSPYNIKNEEEYVKDFISFSKRQVNVNNRLKS